MQLSALPEGIQNGMVDVAFACVSPAAICCQCHCFYFFEDACTFQYIDSTGATTINVLHFALPQGTLTGGGVVKLGCMLEIMSQCHWSNGHSQLPLQLMHDGSIGWFLGQCCQLFCPLPNRMPLNFSLKKILSPFF